MYWQGEQLGWVAASQAARAESSEPAAEELPGPTEAVSPAAVDGVSDGKGGPQEESLLTPNVVPAG